MRRITHFMNDPDNPARAMAFRAYKCNVCGAVHKASDVPVSVLPWITAVVLEKLVQVQEMPQEKCPKGVYAKGSPRR